MTKLYLVNNKPDDYGACRKEIVRVTKEVSEQYYHAVEISEEDYLSLSKYIDVVDEVEESGRTEDERFYGQE